MGHIIISVVIVLSFSSISYYVAQPQRIEASAVTKQFSGEELYRGIFFFEGDAGEKMSPEIVKEVEKEQRNPEVK